MQSIMRRKIISLIGSICLLMLVTLIYLFDNQPWNIEKIISFIIFGIYTFFIIPSIQYYLFINKNNTNKDWIEKGYSFGASKLIFPILLAPIYGFRFYMIRKIWLY